MYEEAGASNMKRDDDLAPSFTQPVTQALAAMASRHESRPSASAQHER